MKRKRGLLQKAWLHFTERKLYRGHPPLKECKKLGREQGLLVISTKCVQIKFRIANGNFGLNFRLVKSKGTLNTYISGCLMLLFFSLSTACQVHVLY